MANGFSFTEQYDASSVVSQFSRLLSESARKIKTACGDGKHKYDDQTLSDTWLNDSSQFSDVYAAVHCLAVM